jgi:hypothetical protein
MAAPARLSAVLQHLERGRPAPRPAAAAVAAEPVVTAVETLRCARFPSMLWVRVETSAGQVGWGSAASHIA